MVGWVGALWAMRPHPTREGRQVLLRFFLTSQGVGDSVGWLSTPSLVPNLGLAWR